MNDINDLERRISAALDRIARGLDGAAGSGDADSDEVAKLRETLTAEQASNEQLTERVRAWKEKHSTVVGEFEQSIETLTNQVTLQEAELRKLRSERDAQIAEMDSILSELKPLLGGAANA